MTADVAMSGAYADLKDRLAKLKADGAALAAPGLSPTNLIEKVHAVANFAHDAVGALDDAVVLLGAIGEGFGVLDAGATAGTIATIDGPVGGSFNPSYRGPDTPINPDKVAL